MSKLKTISIFIAVFLLSALTISTVSAYNHATFQVSFDNLVYKADISGEDRGFSLSRTTRASRWNGEYYDWSYGPNIRHKNSYSPGISDKLALQAFRTFSADSRDQSRLELEKERRSRYYPRYGHYRYRPYYRYSYRF